MSEKNKKVNYNRPLTKEQRANEIAREQAKVVFDTFRDEGIIDLLPQAELASTDAMGGMAVALVQNGGNVSNREGFAGVVDPEGEIERRRLKRVEQKDELTGLANLNALNAALPSAEQNPKLAVLFVDANNFGLINKEISDDEGDMALKLVAKHLSDITVAVTDTNERVFRKGGDEFVIIAPKNKAKQLKSAIMSWYESEDHPGGVVHTTEGDVGYVEYKPEAGDNIIISLSVGVGNTKSEADEDARRVKKTIKPQIAKAIDDGSDVKTLPIS